MTQRQFVLQIDKIGILLNFSDQEMYAIGDRFLAGAIRVQKKSQVEA